MTQTENADALFGDEHVARYRETDGEVGHDWRGARVLLLTTTGRRSGEPRTTPLIYRRDEEAAGDVFVIVASKGGAPEPPAWFLNLEEQPEVELQVLGDVFRARASVVPAADKPRLWSLMVEEWPAYDDYQAKTDREIPLVALERL